MSIPPDSILVNPQEIINACEDAEINASLSAHNAAATNSTSTTSDGGNGASTNNVSVPSLDIVLVTQLAALLHTRQYDHGRHLYRRYACIVEGETDVNANASAIANANVASAPISLPQFGALWKAAKPWMMGHAQSQFISDTDNTDNASSGSGSGSICDVFSSLQDCITAVSNSNANMPIQPLATYAGQLQTSLRDTMANTIEDLYECITPAECARLLGYANNGSDNGNSSEHVNGGACMSEYLQGRNWATEQGKKQGQGVVWIPCNSNSKERNDLEGPGSNSRSDHGVHQNDRISYLTNIVSFLETQKLNA
eukprot:CAMPEP_0194106940 /NCGR_PEP_ID=MMETSP0150-20130528/6911_1 /TAXON_ID=122233 /ORGANISM="Chaetoceros debilis, Strain MM31A-1" /LENGTH=311 /DNA_ID=CAMNT_0038795213 /DNA_START=12 /DNA_END=947 /DNA_ORIENTATION=-